MRRGHAEAGAIYIVVRSAQGVRLFVPAPSMPGDEAERRWTERSVDAGAAESRLTEVLTREAEFDPDIWVVEVDDREGRHWLDDVLTLD